MVHQAPPVYSMFSPLAGLLRPAKVPVADLAALAFDICWAGIRFEVVRPDVANGFVQAFSSSYDLAGYRAVFLFIAIPDGD